MIFAHLIFVTKSTPMGSGGNLTLPNNNFSVFSYVNSLPPAYIFVLYKVFLPIIADIIVVSGDSVSAGSVFQILLPFYYYKMVSNVRALGASYISMGVWEKEKSPLFCHAYSISHLDPPPRVAQLLCFRV